MLLPSHRESNREAKSFFINLQMVLTAYTKRCIVRTDEPKQTASSVQLTLARGKENVKRKGSAMKKLVAIEATAEERSKINDGIAAVRGVLARFKETNMAAACYAPTVIIQVQELELWWKLATPGRPAQTGRTIDEAFRELAESSDAAFMRTRAQALRDAADRMEREADEIEGGPKTEGDEN